jgi:hypothetical protein
MDYKNGKIYMLEPTCEYDEGDVYYGHTTSTLVKRLSQHKAPSNKTASKILIEKYGRDNIKSVLMELYPCSCKDELKAVEAKYQRENKCVNKRIEYRTGKEYYEDNRDRVAVRGKEYRQANPEKISEQKKDYYQNNREKVLEQNEEYRQANRDKINAQRRKAYAKKKLSKLNV